jgi:putative transcriptional regulator
MTTIELNDLNGKLLVATAQANQDPYFAHTLIFIHQHTVQPETAGILPCIGVIINRVSALHLIDLFERSKSLKPLSGLRGDQATDRLVTVGGQPILDGGPLASQHGFILTDQAEDSVQVAEILSLTESRLQALCHGEHSGRYEVILGCAAWAQDKLKSEISKGFWEVLPAHESLLFDVPYRDRYAVACQHLGFKPGQWVQHVGHA